MIALIKRFVRYLRKTKEKRSVLNSHHQVAVYDVDKKEFDYKRYGFTFYESVLFNLKKNDYKKYITTWEAYQPRFNLSKYNMISDDKYLFSLVFGKYIETPVSFGLINNGTIDSLVPGLNKNNLYVFLLKNGGGVIKDRFGYNGFNIYVLKAKNNQLFFRNDAVTEKELESIVASFKNILY